MNGQPLPKHVALILDGNGRWAQRRGLPRIMGHRAGVRALKKSIEFIRQSGVQYLSVFGFSTENWCRPDGEVHGMMHLFATVLRRYERDILGARTRIHWIGNPIGVPKAVGERLVQLMEKTKCEDNFHLILAINYGGRDEVVRAAQRMAATVSSADLPKWTWKNFSSFLDTKDLPDIDLLIRTAGEQRLSNFMLLQMAYAEIFFTPCFWPDFNEKVFREALDFYATRQRRFGGIKNQCET